MGRIRQISVYILLIGLLLCSGCSDKFTRERYETIYIGQPKDSVHRVLGTPDRSENSRWVYINEMPYERAEITFEDGKVARKYWSYVNEPEKPKTTRPHESQQQTQ